MAALLLCNSRYSPAAFHVLYRRACWQRNIDTIGYRVLRAIEYEVFTGTFCCVELGRGWSGERLVQLADLRARLQCQEGLARIVAFHHCGALSRSPEALPGMPLSNPASVSGVRDSALSLAEQKLNRSRL